jgi:hypothetical protein
MKNKKNLICILQKEISRSGFVMKEKNGIANKFQMDLKNANPNGGDVAERNSKSMRFSFLENC